MFGRDEATVDDLKDAIISEYKEITTEILNRVKDSFIKRIDGCIHVECKQFERLLLL